MDALGGPGALSAGPDPLIPAPLREHVFDFWWDPQKLRELPLPVERMAVTELAWHLDLPWWRHESRPFAVTPAEVLDDPAVHYEQFRRTLATDLGVPLDVMWWRGRFTIMDGIHRLLKAELLGLAEVLVRKMPPDLVPEILAQPPARSRWRRVVARGVVPRA